jgi:two-component system sensor histidine kinase TctE
LPGDIYLRDVEFNGQDVRVAYSYVADGQMPRERWVLVEVGETTEKRTQLANKIVASVILPQFIIIPLAVMLVWFGLSRGLRPLTRLRKTIETRDPATFRRSPRAGCRRNWSRWSRPSTKCWNG